VRRCRAVLAALILAALAACSGNPPHISRISAQLVYIDDVVAGRVSEELSLFIVPEDKDGLDDLEYVHVISDKAELYWSLDSSLWTQLKSQNDDWIGSARLAIPLNEHFPRGEYRVMLYDLSGDSDEQKFRLEANSVEPKDIPFPEATVAGGRITVKGPSEWYTLLIYKTSDAYARSYPVQARGIEVETIRRADPLLGAGFTFYVYTYWTDGSAGLLAGPYRVE